MTNEQLAVLLAGYQGRISKEVGLIKAELPREFFKEELGFLGMTFTSTPILRGLVDILDEITTHIEMLTGEGE